MSELNFTPTVTSYWVVEAPEPLPYVSRSAIRRVKDPLPPPTECPYCSGSVKLVNNCEIYGAPVGDWPFAYHCQKCCEAYVGVHPDTHIPLGYMADKELRKARQQAKVSFHEMLYTCHKSRSEGYHWLAEQLGLSISSTHYGWLNMIQCEQALKITSQEIQKCRKS